MRRSRASSISRKSSIDELYSAYSQRYDTIQSLIGKKYGATMLAEKLDKRAFEMQYKAHAYPEDPQKRYERDLAAGKKVRPPTEEQKRIYHEKWEPLRKYSSQRVIEILVRKESTSIASGTAKAAINRLRKEREKAALDTLKKRMKQRGVSEKDLKKITLDKILEKEVPKELRSAKREFRQIESEIEEIGGVRIPASAEEIRYMRTNELWDYIKDWYDKEGKALYQEERAKGKSGKEARKAIYDLFFYNGS